MFRNANIKQVTLPSLTVSYLRTYTYIAIVYSLTITAPYTGDTGLRGSNGEPGIQGTKGDKVVIHVIYNISCHLT